MAKRTYEQALDHVEQYEKQLRSEGAMTVDTELKWNKENIQKWLEDFFYYSYYANSDSVITYYKTNRVGGNNLDKESSSRSRRRSLGDIFKLSLTHFDSNVKLVEVMQALYDIVETPIIIKTRNSSNYSSIIYHTICGTVHRRVFHIANPGTHSSYKFTTSGETNGGSDEVNITLEDYKTLCSKEAKLARQQELDKAELIRKAQEVKTKHLDIDAAVSAKIKELLESNDTNRRTLVRAVQKINKTSGVKRKAAII